MLLGLIDSARKTMDVGGVGPTNRFGRVRACTQPRVRVRVVMSLPDKTESSYEGLTQLSRSGVQVRTVKSPDIHSKSILVDGRRAYIGSINFTATSMDQNRELGVLTTSPEVLKPLGAAFLQDWAKGTPFKAAAK
ncbi:MAG: phospholipase D-like domain-containing protein [Chloroflexia bacterium]